MKSISPKSTALAAAIAVLLFAVVFGVLSLGMAVWIPLLLLLATAVLFAVPVHALPALALVLFALLPLGYIAGVPATMGRFLTPAALTIVVALLRQRGRPAVNRIPRFWTVCAIALLLLSAASFIWSLDAQRSALWTATVAVVLFGFAHLSMRSTPQSVHALQRTWLCVGLILGVAAITEGLVQRSFLAALYARGASSGIGFTQHWDSIRATTTLGHPLMNGTFFATTAVYAIILTMRRRSKLALASGAVSAGGAIFSVSRSAAAAIAAGLIVGLLVCLASRQLPFGRKAVGLLVGVGAAAAVLFSPIIQSRSDSAEGSGSADARAVILDRALEFAGESNYLGVGAGMAQERAIMGGLNMPIENSYAGVLVSLGAAGTIIFVCLLATIALVAARRQAPEVVAAVCAFGTAIWAWPLVDNYPSALVMLGALAYIGFSGHRRSELIPDDARTLSALTISR
ncbi:O-antigen ligase family protein [Saxibacter everestensis]|uniref:O-antigen ligase family protein n=1 Tax=Saxibacter everestensis TaxID=2909229 RepID=A0ABY8QT43_9MICO|nr:O-antigen ligase family protein [Brevibacteriaceae bacterium ZFBP1038]